MAEQSSGFTASAANWRDTIKMNNRRSMIVIFLFIVIYVCVGLIIDLYVQSGHYPHAPLSEIFYAILTFQIPPYATMIACVLAVIFILITFAFHDRLMLMGAEYREITAESAQTIKEKQLFNVVEEMKVAAGLSYMPKLYIIDAAYMNAFASGYSEKSAMMAITQGLLDKLDRSELTAVMAHELSHIRHMDIKLTLMASVLSNIMLIIVDMLFWNAMFSSDDEEADSKRNNSLFMIVLVLRYLLPLVTVILMMYLSRSREYMADSGCVELMRDNEPLARALLKIQEDHEANRDAYASAYTTTPNEGVRRQAYFYDPIVAGIEAQSSISDFFSTHPTTEDRLRAIGITVK